MCLSLGVIERPVGAPAATLRRLQDGGSLDNSGAAGKGLFPTPSSVRLVRCTHMSPSHSTLTGGI